MNITILTLSLTTGGAERVICNLCNDYLIKIHKVTIISLMAAKPEYNLDKRVRLIHVDEKEDEYRQNPLIRMPRRKKKLYRILTRLGAVTGKVRTGDVGKRRCPAEEEASKQDLIISFLPEPNFLICELRRKLDCPVIISVRNDPVKEYGSTLRRVLMKRDYPKADGYVFQTNQARDYFSFSQHIYNRAVVISNPLGQEFCDEEEQTAQRKHRIIYAGRLERAKNPLMILNAFAKVHKRYPSYELVLYGEGSMREELESRVKELNMESSIKLPGVATDMKRVYREAEIFVLASNYEGMPNSLMEAMAMGLPCIATDCPCGGPAYLIQDGENGLLIPVGDENALSDALERLMRDKTYPVKLGIRARRIREKLSPEKIYAQWGDYIESICNEYKKTI